MTLPGLALLAVTAASPCAAELAETKRWLARLAEVADRGELMVAPDVHLAVRKGNPFVFRDTLNVVTLARDKTSMGSAIASTTATSVELESLLRGELERKAAFDKGLGKKPTKAELVVIVDADVEWARVVAVTNAAVNIGLDQVGFLFNDLEGEKLRPPRSSIDAEIETIRSTPDPGQKASMIGDPKLGPQRALRACASVAKVFGTERPEPGDSGANFFKKLDGAVSQCDCAWDRAAFQATLWLLFGRPLQNELTVSLSQKGKPISMLSTELWSKGHVQLKAEGPVRLVSK